MEIKTVKISELKPHPKNPRVHPDSAIDKLVRSIKEYGWTNPVLVSADGYVLAGNARLKAAEKAGIKEVPVIYLPLEGAKAEAYLIADNRLQDETDWDYEKLKDLLQELDTGEFDLELTGFDMGEIEDLMTLFHVPGEIIEDDVPEPPEEAITKPGNLWILGRHRLLCGDATVAADVERLMDGKKARFVFTDPPWNVDYGSDTRHPSWKPRQILNDRMSTEEFGAFLLRAFNCMREVSEAGCMTYVVMSAQEWGNVMNALREAGYHWSSTIIWKKDSLVLSRKDYHTQYEPIWYGWLEGTRLCPLKDRKQSDVWEIPRPKVSEEHPTMKPVSLVAKAMLNSSRAGDLALDLFGGSGTTMIAAQQTGRVCFMMELDPKYCDVIIERWEQFTGQKAVLLS